MPMIIYQLFGLLILLSLNACATNPVTGKQNLVLLSEQNEIALGNQTNQEVLKQYVIYDNPPLQNYVQRIGNKLAAQSHRSGLNYSFTVLDSKEVNAFALPGGYIYITRGLMAYLNSEAELAAVLGHEIGHVTARHSVRQYSANQITNLGVALGSIFIPGMNQATNQLAQMFGTALLRGYGREHELEADRLGAEYLARTNYDPQAMLDVISVLKDQEVFERDRARIESREPRIYHGVFSSHPDNDTRLQEIVSTAGRLADANKLNFVGTEEYLTLIDNMTYGDSPKEGILRGRDFYHEELGFALRFPDKWRVSNLPDQIILTAPGDNAMMQIRAEPIDTRLSPRDFLIQKLGLSNLSDERSLSVNGLNAFTGMSVINSGRGNQPTRLYVIYYGQSACIFVGISRNPSQLRQYEPDITKTANSFRQLTESERLLAQPLRLNLFRATDNTRFSALAKQTPLENQAESTLRLLNGLYPNGEPTEGMLIKTID